MNDIRLEMSPAALLGILVRDAAGNPIGRGIKFSAMPATGIGTSSTPGFDGRGRATIRNLAPGKYSLTVEAPGYRPAIRSGIELVEGENPALTFLLERE